MYGQNGQASAICGLTASMSSSPPAAPDPDGDDGMHPPTGIRQFTKIPPITSLLNSLTGYVTL